MQRTSAALAVIASVALSALPCLGQTVAPKGSVHGSRIEVKLAEGTGAILIGGELRSTTGTDLSAVEELFRRFSAKHLIDVPMHVLDQWHRQSNQRLHGGRRRPGHLGLWFLVETETDNEARALLADLQDCSAVETAYLAMTPFLATAPTDPVPTTPSFTELQEYMGAPPMGLNSYFAHGILGGRGRDVAVNHVEADWLLDHEDASQINLAGMIVPPTEAGGSNDYNHGIASSGLIVADRNSYGINGMADQVKIRTLSWVNPRGLPDTIAQALQHSDEGDVLLIVVQFLLGQRGPSDYVPAEFLQSNFDAILTATSLGRHVVQNAGNGYSNLDDPRYLRRFDLGFRDSGSIMVGATAGSRLQRARFSNYGSRVTANAWGLDVVTTGYGDLFWGAGDLRQAYTSYFSGTSSATPMVTAVVASLVGTARQQLERDLSVDEVRQLLREHGTPVAGNIGLRPDLQALLAALGIPDGLQVEGTPIAPGESRDLHMTGPPGGAFNLFASLALSSVDLGLNRKVHLDLGTLVHVDAAALTGGTATYRLAIPNTSDLRGMDLYFQGIITDPMGSLRISNSVQLTIR